MAKKTDNMFETLSKIRQPKKTTESVSNDNNNEGEKEKMNQLNNTENENIIINNNTEQSFLAKFQTKKKPTVEETHTRQTYLIRNDLIKRLEKIAKKQDRGFKTALVNEGIKRLLDELEGK